MKLPAKRQQLAIILGVVVALIVISTVSVVWWRRGQNQREKADNSLTANEKVRKEIVEEAEKYQAGLNADHEARYKKTEGITTVSEFEKRFKAAEREQFIILMLQRLETEKNYNAGLDFINYATANYPKITNTVDFHTWAYLISKGLGRADLQTVHRQKTEEILRSQGVIGGNESLPESYFTGGGQSE